MYECMMLQDVCMNKIHTRICMKTYWKVAWLYHAARCMATVAVILAQLAEQRLLLTWQIWSLNPAIHDFYCQLYEKEEIEAKDPGNSPFTMWYLSDDVAFQTYPSYQSLPLAPKTPRVLFIKQTTFNVFDICQCFQLYKWSYLRSVWPEKIAECL